MQKIKYRTEQDTSILFSVSHPTKNRTSLRYRMANSRAMCFWKLPGKATGLEVSFRGIENDRGGVVPTTALPPPPGVPSPFL